MKTISVRELKKQKKKREIEQYTNCPHARRCGLSVKCIYPHTGNKDVAIRDIDECYLWISNNWWGSLWYVHYGGMSPCPLERPELPDINPSNKGVN